MGYRERPPEPGAKYVTRPVVLGCGKLVSGRRVRFVGYQLRLKRTALCIDVVEIATGRRAGCGTNEVFGGGALDARSTSTKSGRSRIGGGTGSSVSRVSVRYELDGRLEDTRALLVRVGDPKLLRAIRVQRPFGQYLAEVPANARAVFAYGEDAQGHRVGAAFFDRFGLPIGEGRRCQSLLRIESLRLIGHRRASAPAALEVRISYPHGSALSVEVTQGARIQHADLVPSSRARRTVRLPVQLDAGHQTLFDVTAEGIPRDLHRCDSATRRSAPRTLIVRTG